MSKTGKLALYNCLLFGAVALGFLVPFTDAPLLGPWEPHYGQVAREMLHTGDLLDPRYQGKPFWSKPILAPFLCMISYSLFGVSEFSTRLPAILFGFSALMVLFIYIRKTINARCAWCVGLALLLTPYFGLMSRRFLTDIFFMAPLLVSIIYFKDALDGGNRRKARIAWGLIGVSLLAKGLLPVFIAIGAMGSYLVVSNKLRHWRNLAPFSGLAIFLIITAPWHVFMTYEHGVRFLEVWFIDNHFARVMGTMGGKPKGSFEFLLKYLSYGCFPIIALTPISILAFRKSKESEPENRKEKSVRKKKPLRQNEHIGVAYLAVCWLCAAALVVFSSSTKFAHYCFPVVPPLSILIGLGIYVLYSDKNLDRPLKLSLLLVSAILLLIIGKDLAHNHVDKSDAAFKIHYWWSLLTLTSDHKIRSWMGEFANPRPWILATMAGTLLSFAFFLFKQKMFRIAGVLGIALAFAVYSAYFYFSLDPAILNVMSCRKITEAYLAERQPEDPLIVYKSWKWRSDIWYADLDHPSVMIRGKKAKIRLLKELEKVKDQRFFIETPKKETEQVNELVKQVTGRELKPIETDKYKSFEDHTLFLAE